MKVAEKLAPHETLLEREAGWETFVAIAQAASTDDEEE